MSIQDGWEAVFAADQRQKTSETDEQRQERLQISKDFVATFSSDHGKRVLDYFKKHTLNQPSWVPGFVEGQAQFREGQNQIIREIEQKIHTSNNIEE